MQRSRERDICRGSGCRGTVAAQFIINIIILHTSTKPSFEKINNPYCSIQTAWIDNCSVFSSSIFQTSFDALEREIRSEFQNLHRFLDEEECKDLERLRRERQKQLKKLKEREKKIAEQGKGLERAITVLNSKLCEEDSPKLLKVRCFAVRRV